MKNKRTKHSPDFKALVALAALREHETIAEIARRYKVNANMVYLTVTDFGGTNEVKH